MEQMLSFDEWHEKQRTGHGTCAHEQFEEMAWNAAIDECAKQQNRIDAEVRAKYEIDQRGKSAEATHAVEQATQTPQAPAASTPPDRPSDKAIIGCVAAHFGVSQATAYDWIVAVADSATHNV